MANMDERQVREHPHSPSGFSPPQCWRCKCIVPYEQLRRRVVNTSASRGVHVVSGDFVSVLNRYEIVNLCSVRAAALTAEKRARLDARGLREAWWGRLGFGACFVGMLLFVRQPPLLILALTWLLDRLRVLGIAVLLMGGVFLAEYLMGLEPFRFRRRIRIPWFAVINGVILWGIWRTNLLQKSFAWFVRKRSSAKTAPTPETGLSLSSEDRDSSR
ncbi:MAG: hypothetical protein AB7P69_13025 [Candidatus Binatia bacterium]